MQTGRPVVIAEHGMVSSPHYLASLAGVRVLQEGGNAVDAAIATSAVLHVTMPHQCSPGGDAFWLIYRAEDDCLHALNASGRSPHRISPAALHAQGLERIPVRGAQAVTVPGSVDGWCTAEKRFGSVPLKRLLQPAITYAEQGFPINADLARTIRQHSHELCEFDGWMQTFLRDGHAPSVGDRLVQKQLGATLRAIGDNGRNGFYGGSTADRLADCVQRHGGFLTQEDLEDHTSDWLVPIKTEYRGHTVYEVPPNSRGAIVLIALNIIEGFDISSLGYDSPEAINIVMTAYQLAKDVFGDIAVDAGSDSEPLKTRLSKSFADGLRSRIRSHAPADSASIDHEHRGNTVYISVLDSSGNAVSLIDSTYYSFGSGLVVDGTGLILQNRGAYFSLDPAHPSYLEPHKRTIHTLMPSMVFKDDKPWLVFGSMGGDGQAQTQLQILTRVVDSGLNVQQAIEAPRWVKGGTLVGEKIDGLRMEDRFPSETSLKMKNLGYSITPLGDWSDRVGVAQAILIDQERRVAHGGADPRGEGLALGW